MHTKPKTALSEIVSVICDDICIADVAQFLHGQLLVGQTDWRAVGRGALVVLRDEPAEVESIQAGLCSAARTNVVLRIVMLTITVV
jgi:hypothetical protein